MELSMASLRSFGICTWRTRPTNDSTSDTMKIFRCDFKIGMARLQPCLGPVGIDRSLSARRTRAGSGPGTNRDPLSSVGIRPRRPGQVGNCLHGGTAAVVFVFPAPFSFVW